MFPRRRRVEGGEVGMGGACGARRIEVGPAGEGMKREFQTQEMMCTENKTNLADNE